MHCLLLALIRLIAVSICFLVLFSSEVWADRDETGLPRLVLQITVDQLRGDMPYRYYDRLGEGGFRYLLEHGIVYTDAHRHHSNTETIVGHATLATGADPAAHGMVANVWFDRESGALGYNIEDERYPLLPTREKEKKDAEIDPTQKVARTRGRSPAAILVSTFSDELAVHFGGQSKIFGVSVKDPTTGNMYYTRDIDEEKGGAIIFEDAKTGTKITLQNSEVKEIHKDEFERALMPDK
jgi:hypothetical protein